MGVLCIHVGTREAQRAHVTQAAFQDEEVGGGLGGPARAYDLAEYYSKDSACYSKLILKCK